MCILIWSQNYLNEISSFTDYHNLEYHDLKFIITGST
jgi:hypothetical protein